MSYRFVVVGLALFGLFTSSLNAQVRDERPMELSGMSASEAFDVKDDLAFDPNADLVRRLLYRIKKTSLATRKQAAAYTAKISPSEESKKIEDLRFWMFQRNARVKLIEKIAIPDAPAEAGVRHYYVCHAVPATGAAPYAIIARTIPRELPVDVEIDEPVSFRGWLYCLATHQELPDSISSELPSIHFIADQIAWHPDSSRLASPSQVALASLGFDVAQIDTIRRSNAKPLGREESEAFFQMLKAIQGHDPSSEAFSETKLPRVSLRQVLKSSATHFAKPITITAPCRTCTVTAITDPEARRRLGVDHYYQLVLFPDLKQDIVLSENGKSVTYSRYPVTVCCLELPNGLKPKEMERRQISVDGFFYRIWRYQSDITAAADVSGTVSPLIMAKKAELLGTPTGKLNRMLMLFILAVAGAIAALIVYLRFTNRRDQTHTESLLKELPDKIDVGGLEID